MMTREDRDSLVEMLAKIPITETKGSLLHAIGRLLRVIDISENSIMIPTLLKDKCEFDAYEMLTLAKVLKASILGHNDLVEFYMSESSSHSHNTQLAHHHHLNSISSSSNSSSSSHGTGSGSSGVSAGGSGNNINGHATGHGHATGNNNNNHSTKLNHLSAIHQLSATPSLKSSASDSNSSSPSTPIPQANSIGSINSQKQLQLKHQLGNNGDPDATVRLLLQIEQLKVFIPQVTGIFESIIELYKNSVDTITYGSHHSD